MKIGIDLGTTYSVVSYIDEKGNKKIVTNSEGERKTPSVIMFEDNQIIVGDIAKNEKSFAPENVLELIKRSMGQKIEFPHDGKNYTPEQLSAFILKKLVQDTEAATGKKVEGAVITVPAYFNDAERNATIDAGKIAGINVLGIINEPTAAAIAYGFESRNEASNVLVYDLGGGTFDVTILKIDDNSLEILATDGDHKLGGADFDNKIIDYIADEIEEKFDIDIDDDDELLSEVSAEAERIKKGLSTKSSERISLKIDGMSYRGSYTLEMFENAIDGLIDRSLTIMQVSLLEANLQFSDIDKILLVGGSTRIPLVAKKIREKTGINPSKELNPDEVVAYGAALLAEKKNVEDFEIKNLNNVQERIKDIEIKDVNSHGIGIISQNLDNQEENVLIVPKNTIIPTTQRRSFFTSIENQEYVNLRITEGDDEDIEYVEIIAQTNIFLPSNRPVGSELIFEVGFDVDGKIIITAYDGLTNTRLDSVVVERKNNLKKIEIDKLSNDLSNTIIK